MTRTLLLAGSLSFLPIRLLGMGIQKGLLMNTVQHVLDYIFPPQCAFCKCSGYVLCTSCLANIHPLTPPRCLHCYGQLITHGLCIACQRHPLQISGLRAVSTYDDPLRSCIHALKYNGHKRLAGPLGSLLAQAFYTYGMQADIILPVPLHSERQQQRGYNHASLLAQVCSAQLGIPLQEHILVRHRATPAQVGLGARERQQNVAGAFLCTATPTEQTLYRHKILIIDDVCTTGATLEACAAPLFAAGAAAVWGLVLARPA